MTWRCQVFLQMQNFFFHFFFSKTSAFIFVFELGFFALLSTAIIMKYHCKLIDWIIIIMCHFFAKIDKNEYHRTFDGDDTTSKKYVSGIHWVLVHVSYMKTLFVFEKKNCCFRLSIRIFKKKYRKKACPSAVMPTWRAQFRVFNPECKINSILMIG